jgi:predicted DNA-binding transcriptional regulator AlpA
MIIEGEKYITEKEVSRNVERSVKWVQSMRYTYQDFPHYKINRRVLFKQSEVDSWIKDHLMALGKLSVAECKLRKKGVGKNLGLQPAITG